MKTILNQIELLSLMIVLTIFTTGCEAIQGIFKAGVWSGVLMVVGIIALAIFIISRLFKK